MKKKERRGLEREQRKKKKTSDRRWRKIYLIAIVLIALAAAMLIWLFSADKEISFESAKGNPSLRESYVEKVVEKIGDSPYVASVSFVPKRMEESGRKRSPRGIVAMAVEVPPDSRTLEIGLPLKILIFPTAFETKVIQSNTDFASALRHEYRHAEVISLRRVNLFPYADFVNTNGKWNESLLRDAIELDAISRELAGMEKISKQYRANQIKAYSTHYIDIWDQEDGMNPQLIKKMKIEFFQPWMLPSPNLARKGVWELRDEKTGRVYPLPQEIMEKFSKNGKG